MARSALVTTSSDEFWKTFDDDPYAHLELLENRVAPLVAHFSKQRKLSPGDIAELKRLIEGLGNDDAN